MSRIRVRVIAALAAVTLLAGSCSSSTDTTTSDSPDTTSVAETSTTIETDTTVAPSTTIAAADGVGNPFVQDLWIYEQFRTVSTDGETVDHTEAVVTHLDGLADSSAALELIPGMTFTPVESVKAAVKDNEGNVRDDVTAIAGVVTNELGTAFAVLGTVHADGDGQIEPNNRVFLDTSFLGDAIAIGDVAAVDYALVQLLSTSDDTESELSPQDLFTHRAAAELIQYTADDDGEPLIIVNELGQIVAGSEGPEVPAKSDSMLKGFRKGIQKCVRRPGLACLPNYFKEFGKGATDSLSQIDKQLPVGPPPPRPPDPCRYGCGKSVGDPHLGTFDGLGYDMQAVGEFILAQGDDVEVQIRTEGNSAGQVSWITATAIGVGDERIVVSPHLVVVNGEEASEVALREGVEYPGFRLQGTSIRTWIETDAGVVVTIEHRSRKMIDLVVGLPENPAEGWVGMLGDADGDPGNDLTSRDGVVTADATDDAFYSGYVASWRITDEESLFDYGAGETTATFTDLRYPTVRFGIDDLDDTTRRRAEAACRMAGVEKSPAFEECVLDFGVTGDVAFLRSAAFSDTIEGIRNGTLHQDGTIRDEGELTPVVETAWTMNADGIIRGDDPVTFECPPWPLPELTQRRLWGDLEYTSDSFVCQAAVHAGVITMREGGTVLVTPQPGKDSYDGTERNGTVSDSWGPWSSGFTVSSG